MTQSSCDIAVVGAGLVGLATAWQLARRQSGLRITVVEAERAVAQHQSSHNSGVVHAGIYYPPGSLKARLCTRGKMLLEQFCSDHDVPLVRNGKVVVAVRDDELGRLATLYQRAEANGVPQLRRLTPDELREVEPTVEGLAAIHSPTTGVVDFRAVAAALAAGLPAEQVQLITSWPVRELRQSAERVELVGPDDDAIRARFVIVCAGLQADRLAGPAATGIRTVPFRGGWYVVGGPAAASIVGSVYPVPDPSLPFLGVHLTRRIDGTVWAGPSAFLAFSRSDYRRWAVRFRDTAEELAFAGIWRLAAHYPAVTWNEFWQDVSPAVYTRALSRYLPGIQARDLTRGPIGLRAQAMTPAGQLLDDFELRRDGRTLHVINAPSPAATACLAIGEHLADQVVAAA